MEVTITKDNITVTVSKIETVVLVDGNVLGSSFMPVKTTDGIIRVGIVNFRNHMELGEEVIKAWRRVQEYEMSQQTESKEAAQRVIDEVNRRGVENLLTAEKEKQWRKVYNNMVNEGGTGIVPIRATVESYEQAKRILGL